MMMIAMQSSGYWFTIWPFVLGLAVGLLAGYRYASWRWRRRRTW